MFNELIKEITRDLEVNETRARGRADVAQSNFEYAVGFILKELWRNSRSIPPTESSINLRAGY